MSSRLYQKFKKILSKVTLFNIGSKLLKVFNALHFFRNRKKALIFGYFLSLCAQTTIILMNYILSIGLGLKVNLSYFFLVIPITFLFSLIPSINGVGVRDAGYVLALKPQGIMPSQALSLSFLATIIPVIISLVGGIFFIFYRFKGVQTPLLSEE
jgi:uncharacterized membrane protein YbhN (UPF0104 family)